MVYSSSRLCSSFSVISYSLLSSRVLSVTLTVRFCQLRSLRSLPAFSFFFLFIIFFTLRDTHFLFLIFFFRQFSAILIFVISYIYFSDTYVYTTEFFPTLCSFTGFMLLVSSTRVLCTLITSAFFLSLLS